MPRLQDQKPDIKRAMVHVGRKLPLAFAVRGIRLESGNSTAELMMLLAPTTSSYVPKTMIFCVGVNPIRQALRRDVDNFFEDYA